MSVTSSRRAVWRAPNNPFSFLYQRETGPDNSELVHSLLRKRLSVSTNLYRRDLKGHYGCVNAIEFSNGGGQWIVSGGDDRRVLLWQVQKALMDASEPVSMKGEHISNIFCLAFNRDNQKLFSGGNDEQVIVHDLETGDTVDVFRHEDAVYGISADPNNACVFASACDDGRVLVYDIREPPSSDPFCLANHTSSMHAVMYNPMEPRLLATANAREGVELWDIRKPKKCCLRYGNSLVQQGSMSVRISRLGDKVIALRRRLPPVLYRTHSPDPLCEFDHTGYYNSCTMKSCSFAGENDEYVLSGSDDFNLYMWKIPDNLSERHYTREAHMILKGHRSIVNQVRYNPTDSLIVSSGVEKIVKVWSPFPMANCSGDLERSNTLDLSERPVYTPDEYINLVLRSGHIMSHDYSHQSTDEDPRMMAFFDSLVQGEMNVSSDDFSSNEEELYERIVQVTRSEIDINEQDLPDDLSSNSGDDSDFSPFTLAFASVMAAQTAEGGGHSRLLDTPELEQTESSNTLVEANDPNSASRKSISDIIAQNRKEVLKAMEAKKTSKVKKSCGKTNLRIMSSDSDSDEEPVVKRHRKTKSESDSCKESEKQKAKCRLKRLRELRNQVLNSDSDSSDGGGFRKRTRIESEGASAGDDVVELNTEEQKSSFHNNGCSKDASGPGLGPYLHEHETGHNSRVGSSSERPGNVDHSAKSCGSSFDENSLDQGRSSVSGGSSSLLEVHSRWNGDQNQDKLHQSTSKKDNCHTKDSNSSEDCLPSTSKCDSDTLNGNKTENFKKRHKKRGESCSEDKEQNSNEPASGENQQSSESLWTEFKRFKNRLERARRYYRKQSSSQASSDDD